MSGIDLGGLGDQLYRARWESLSKPLQGPEGVGQEPQQLPVEGVESEEFSSVLEGAIDRIDGLGKDVGNKVQALASGQPVALHDIMMAMGKSEVSFNLMLEVRNKLLDAWEKLSRSVV